MAFDSLILISFIFQCVSDRPFATIVYQTGPILCCDQLTWRGHAYITNFNQTTALSTGYIFQQQQSLRPFQWEPVGPVINRFRLVKFFSCSVGWKTVFDLFSWSTFSTGLKPKKHLSRDCSSCKEFPRLNLKRLENCYVKKRQPYQPKLVSVETVDANRTWP